MKHSNTSYTVKQRILLNISTWSYVDTFICSKVKLKPLRKITPTYLPKSSSNLWGKIGELSKRRFSPFPTSPSQCVFLSLFYPHKGNHTFPFLLMVGISARIFLHFPSFLHQFPLFQVRRWLQPSNASLDEGWREGCTNKLRGDVCKMRFGKILLSCG